VYGFHPPEFSSIVHGPRLLKWVEQVSLTVEFSDQPLRGKRDEHPLTPHIGVQIGKFAKAWAITCPILDILICATSRYHFV
jgi:hypothetical protein